LAPVKDVERERATPTMPVPSLRGGSLPVRLEKGAHMLHGLAHARTCLAILGLASLASCVGPARTFDVYASRAENSVEQARSAVQATLAAIDVAVAKQAFAPFVSITIQDANETVEGAESGFASIQPPDEQSDALRREVVPVLSDAAEAVAQARIAARRVDVGRLAELRPRLTDLSQQLDQLVEELT
jgi:hypothetical protein